MGRFLLAAVLVLTGCATQFPTQMGPDATAAIFDVLASGPGQAVALEGVEGQYQISKSALEPEREALFRELRSAPVKLQWFEVPYDERARDVEVVISPEPSDRATRVVLYRHRRRMSVQLKRGHLQLVRSVDGYDIRFIEIDEDGDLVAVRRVELEPVSNVDRAWDDLERAALGESVSPRDVHHVPIAGPLVAGEMLYILVAD